jgi:hypothetical protein
MATYQLMTQMTGSPVRTGHANDDRGLRRDMSDAIRSGCCAFAQLVNLKTGEILHSYGSAR